MNLLEELTNRIELNNLWQGRLSLHRNEYLKVEGTTDKRLFYIVSGSLRLFVIDGFEEHTIRFGYSSNLISALDSFISEQPSDLYIQALKKTELKFVHKNTFIQFIESSGLNLKLWLSLLEQLVFQQLERERDLLTTSPKERYLRVLKRSPRLFQEIPHKYIANYLRMSSETLSRLKKS